MKIAERIAGMHEEMIRWRHDFHKHPELSFEETRTSEKIAQRLTSFGILVHRGLGRTGVVGTLRAGKAQNAIGLRADMDALPITEENNFDYCSRNIGKMHACGHDGHTTMLLGAAKYLAESRNFDGTVHFIFQPAEEVGGAIKMIEAGLFDKFPCSAVFGMHNRPNLPSGSFAVHSGPMMAGGAFFDIEITGKGAHGARPETGIDPIVIASHTAIALQTIVSRNLSPLESAVLSITKIKAGKTHNVIPQTACLSGTVRFFSRDILETIKKKMAQIIKGTADAFGAKTKFDFRIVFAPTINDPNEADLAKQICCQIVGSGNVNGSPPLNMGSEDFSFMLEKVPGCFINIGSGSEVNTSEVHNPCYDFNDSILPLGVEFYVRLVESKLSKN